MSLDSARISLQPCIPEDFEALSALRILSMRESLEQIGRFDPQRSRARLERSFYPADTQWICLDGERIGYFTFRPAPDGFHLEHFYLLPAAQSAGIGSFILRQLLQRAEHARFPIYLGALKGSRANAFYERHGFQLNAESEWDRYLVWTPPPLAT
jgi:GNAT superfamily N-acetyltransferase